MQTDKKMGFILLTGGLGYIGSHTAIKLIEEGYDVVIIDNLSRSTTIVLDQIYKITAVRPVFIQGDVKNTNLLRQIFKQYKFLAVMHFAGFKDVSESFSNPLDYYSNNFVASLNLFKAMSEAEVFTLIFSSSANVYGDPLEVPISEEHPINPNNPYGRTKWMVELLLKDLYASDQRWRIAILRYFNPVGAHESGIIGELSSQTKTNLMHLICQVAQKKDMPLRIFGKDYNTSDGTPIRDFIHIVDLAEAHLAVFLFFKQVGQQQGLIELNLGTGKPTTILEFVNTFINVNKVNVPHVFDKRRDGDISISYTNPNLAKDLISWQAQKGVREMCEDSWRWKLYESQSHN